MGPFSLGLRSRVTFAFALGGLLVTALLMVLTLGIAQQVLLADRDEVAEVVVFANAARVQRLLTGDLEALSLSVGDDLHLGHIGGESGDAEEGGGECQDRHERARPAK